MLETPLNKTIIEYFTKYGFKLKLDVCDDNCLVFTKDKGNVKDNIRWSYAVMVDKITKEYYLQQDKPIKDYIRYSFYLKNEETEKLDQCHLHIKTPWIDETINCLQKYHNYYLPFITI